MENIDSFKSKDWFVDWTQAKYNEEMIRYFSESEDYRKRVASHNLFAAQNHLRFVGIYKTNAIELLRLIDERLEPEKQNSAAEDGGTTNSQ